MKSPFSVSFVLGALVALVPAHDALGASADAGTGIDASTEAGALDQAADGGSSADEESPFACNKALCATATGNTACGVASSFGDERAALPVSVAAALAVIGFGGVRRRTHRDKERTR